MTLRPLQHWFENMSSRERIMLVAFLGVAVALWGSLLTKHIKALKQDLDSKNTQLANQALSLSQQKTVEDQLTYYNTKFQTSISGPQLVSLLREFVQQTGIQNQTITQTRQNTPKDSIFNINTVTINFTKTDLRTLVDFTSRVLAKKPYLIINEVNLSSETLNPTLMDGNMQIKSLELKKGALDAASAQTVAAAKN